jgi:hypothetical protein
MLLKQSRLEFARCQWLGSVAQIEIMPLLRQLSDKADIGRDNVKLYLTGSMSSGNAMQSRRR